MGLLMLLNVLLPSLFQLMYKFLKGWCYFLHDFISFIAPASGCTHDNDKNLIDYYVDFCLPEFK